MTPRRSNQLLLPLLIALSTMGAGAAPKGGAPKVVVNILIDQLRSDYLEAFMPLYGNDGFRRLLKDGYIYTQASTVSAQNDRASAAASIATGTSPANHGIVGLRWLDRQTLRPTECTADGTPSQIAVSTLSDELKVATEGKALVYSIAPHRDMAILSAGHTADGVVWMDDYTGIWTTNSYYGTLPSWAEVRNRRHSITAALPQLTWKPVSDLVGNFSYFLSEGMKQPFAHRFNGLDGVRQYKTCGLVNEEISDLAVQCVESSPLGQDALTDYLSVTFYAGNFNHLPVNLAPIEQQDTYVRLDRAIANLVAAVEHKVGLDRALFVITSTGSNDEETDDLSRYKVPMGTFDMKRNAALLNMYLIAVYGQGRYVDGAFGTEIYLNRKLIEDKQINMGELLERAQDFLLQLEGVKDIYTSQRLLQGAWTPGISRIRAGYNARISGDILVQVAPGWRYVNTETKEDVLVRNSYVPFPIIFFGFGLSAQKQDTPVSVDYIAPTLSRAMRIRAPNACTAAPLF